MNIKKVLLGMSMVLATMLSAKADFVTLHTPSNFQVLSVSPNGKWACGVFVDASMETYGYRWNLESGTIEMLGSTMNTAWDVSNDGVVSGDFLDNQALPNKAPIQMPSFWKDGAWNHLQMPEGNITDGFGGGITADGRFMTGTICVDGLYTPYIWENGVLSKSLATGSQAVAYTISPDGKYAAGFNTKDNRTACLWTEEGITYFEDSQVPQSPWNYSRNFSPDGSKLLYWGGWEVEENGDLYLYSVYDMHTGERTRIKAPSEDSDLEYFDISNNGIIVGYNKSRGYIFADGENMYIDDYLALKGVDLSGFDDFYGGTDYYQDQLPIQRVTSLSEDGSVLAMDYYNVKGESAALIIKLNQAADEVRAVEIKAQQLSGINTVGLTWKKLVGANMLRGYNVYRDGKKINGMLPLNSTYFYDKNLEPGTYEYVISALNTAGVETKSEPITVVVADNALEAPYALYGRQKGINSVYASWEVPMSNLAHKRYYDIEETNLEGLSIYVPVEVEMAVRYDKNEMAQYAGYKLSEVSFVPMEQNDFWAINVYTYDNDQNLVLLATQPVTQELRYKQLNTVTFDNPIDLPDGDLLVAIDVMIGIESTQVIGAQNGKSVVGYSDLLRQKEEESFYSTYESSTETGLSISNISWAIDLGLMKGSDNDNDALTHYNVYIDNELAGTTETTTFEAEKVADGKHMLAVEAVYADGSKSKLVNSEISLTSKYPAIKPIKVDTGAEGSTAVTVTWAEPIDNDLTPLTYSTDAVHAHGIKGVSSNGYAMMAAADYQPAMLRGYNGYKVKSFRFYPLADALFTFMLYEDDQLIYDLEVDDFTLGQWNTVEVPDEVIINSHSTYRLVIDCFDPEPDVELLAIDNDIPRAYISDLYSISNGDSWSSLNIETGAIGNWMLGMEIEAPDAKSAGVTGYDVVIDSEVKNEIMLTETEYTYDFGKTDNKLHSLRINTHYELLAEAVAGEGYYFRLNTAGIADGVIAGIELKRESCYLVAEGANAMSIYDITGTEVAKTDGSRININHLTSGIYLVKVSDGNKEMTQKISIR